MRVSESDLACVCQSDPEEVSRSEYLQLNVDVRSALESETRERELRAEGRGGDGCCSKQWKGKALAHAARGLTSHDTLSMFLAVGSSWSGVGKTHSPVRVAGAQCSASQSSRESYKHLEG